MISRDNYWNVVNGLPVPGIDIVKADGSWLIGADGRRWLDFWGDEGVASLGYNSTKVRCAIIDFLELNAPHRLPQVYNSPLRAGYADRLCRMMGYDRAFFANSGTEANEAAIKLARLWQTKHGNPAKMGVLTLPNNFHGTTGFSLAACDSKDSPKRKAGFGPMPEGFGILNLDDSHGRSIEWHSNPEGWREDDVGAVICAPILGNNCVLTYGRGFLEQLREWCDDHGALLLFDEVQSGMGRTGYPAAFMHPEVGVKPDIIALGKGIALGFPMTATLASEDIASAMEPGCHYSSFAGGDFICHMAATLLDWMEDGGLDVVREHGDYITSQFNKRKWVESVDGYGFMRAFTPRWQHFEGFNFCAEASRHGLLLATFRSHGSIRFNPPLNVSRQELDTAFEALDATWAALTR